VTLWFSDFFSIADNTDKGLDNQEPDVV